jgi:thiamine-phosphate pyrophosphorylase
MALSEKLQLYIVTDSRFCDEIASAKSVLAAGATAIQLRMKDVCSKKLLQTAVELRKLTKKYGALFIVNDRVDIALASGADGVHLGQDDMPIEYAKKIAPELIIGISASNLDQAIQGQEQGADYIGVGAIFPTQTKTDASICGIDELKKILSEVSIPLVAIGGINHQNASELLTLGNVGLCCISAILASDNIEQATREMLEIINSFRQHG